MKYWYFIWYHFGMHTLFCKVNLETMVFSFRKTQSLLRKLGNFEIMYDLHLWLNIRPKNKGLFALLAWKLGGSVGWLFFSLIWMLLKCIYSFLYINKWHQIIWWRHGVNIYLLCLYSKLLEQLQCIMKLLFEQFCLKMQNWISEKKKVTQLF